MANLEDQVTLVVFHHPKETLAEQVTLEPKVEGAEEPADRAETHLKMVETVALDLHRIAELDFVVEALEAATEDNFLMDHLEAQVVEQQTQLELTDLAEELVEINNLFLAHLQVEVEELY